MSYIAKFIKNPKNNINLEINIHQINKSNITIFCPGSNETIDGHNNKYGRLADFMQRKDLCNIVRTSNFIKNKENNSNAWLDNLSYSIDYVFDYFSYYYSPKKINMNLIGFFSGASAVSMIANKYPNIKKILLISPDLFFPKKTIKKNLTKFKEEIYIVSSKNKPSEDNAYFFFNSAKNVKKHELEIIPDCDSNFSGEKNSRTLSKIPFWAFGNFNTLESVPFNLKLYD